MLFSTVATTVWRCWIVVFLCLPTLAAAAGDLPCRMTVRRMGNADRHPLASLRVEAAWGHRSLLAWRPWPIDQAAVPDVGNREEVPEGGADEPIDPSATIPFPEHPQHVFWIEVRGVIAARMKWYVEQRLQVARKNQADVLVFEITSPGGEMETSLALARQIRDIDWATTMAFIPDEAISGGAIFALGADLIVMQPGALIGDAGPIQLGVRGFEHADEKIVSYLSSAVAELARAKGRPAAVVQAMVDRSLVVHEAIDTESGRRVFLTQQELDQAQDPNRFRRIQPLPETGQDRFLTVGAERALELGLADLVVANRAELERRLAADRISRTKLTWIDAFVFFLNRPWFTALLLIAGLVGLYLEFAAPGISVAGLTALVCFGLFFWSHILGGTSGWLELLLFLLGVVCLLCEMFLLPGFGAFGLTGILLIIVSLVMATQDFLIPETPEQWRELRFNALVVVGSVVGVLTVLLMQIMFLDSLPGLRRLQLRPPQPAMQPPPTTSSWKDAAERPSNLPAVGTEGIAYCDLRPSGKAMFGDAIVDVLTEGSFVEEGTPVRVLRHEGNRVIVRARTDG
ncbi:MAG: peptidase [Pirellulaceae bacterium]|nr:MAG: peptidase [Pirellulaceae bacterium]